MEWTPPPEPVSWPIDPPIVHGGLSYGVVVMRAPTGEELLKATAIPGASNFDVTIRIIEAVSGVPYDVVKLLPGWRIQQISGYIDEFGGAPAPDPLESWRKARAAEAKAAAVS